jgi:hypothetical protein
MTVVRSTPSGFGRHRDDVFGRNGALDHGTPWLSHPGRPESRPSGYPSPDANAHGLHLHQGYLLTVHRIALYSRCIPEDRSIRSSDMGRDDPVL